MLPATRVQSREWQQELGADDVDEARRLEALQTTPQRVSAQGRQGKLDQASSRPRQTLTGSASERGKRRHRPELFLLAVRDSGARVERAMREARARRERGRCAKATILLLLTPKDKSPHPSATSQHARRWSKANLSIDEKARAGKRAAMLRAVGYSGRAEI